MWKCTATAMAAAGLLSAAPAMAQGVDPTYQSMVMYGINSGNGQLLRYDFTNNTRSTVGTVRIGEGSPLMGIDAGAVCPVHACGNMYAFWTNPDDGEAKLVYVSLTTAAATVVGETLGAGEITGATAVQTAVADGVNPAQWSVYALQEVQQVEAAEFDIEGLININPNNSPHAEFQMSTPGGDYTRDDLHEDTDVDDDGVFYHGEASVVVVKPKGNGSQNDLIIDGQAFDLQNNTTYVFTAVEGHPMNVKVFNDHMHNGKAMGKWWIEIENGRVTFNDEQVITTTTSLINVDHKTGVSQFIMELGQQYNSLSTTDGQTFYATADDELWMINAAAKTESLVGNTGEGDMMAGEMVGSTLMAFETIGDSLVPVNPLDGSKQGYSAHLNLEDLGTIVFVPATLDPHNASPAID